MGFTEMEVEDLCMKYDMDYEKMREWYDGYHITKSLSHFLQDQLLLQSQEKILEIIGVQQKHMKH